MAGRKRGRHGRRLAIMDSLNSGRSGISVNDARENDNDYDDDDW